MAKNEAVFPPIPVTKVLSRTVGNVTVVTKLYGDVSAARLDKELKEIEHRVFQLTPLPPRVKRERPAVIHDQLDRWTMEPMMSGGRR